MLLQLGMLPMSSLPFSTRTVLPECSSCNTGRNLGEKLNLLRMAPRMSIDGGKYLGEFNEGYEYKYKVYAAALHFSLLATWAWRVSLCFLSCDGNRAGFLGRFPPCQVAVCPLWLWREHVSCGWCEKDDVVIVIFSFVAFPFVLCWHWWPFWSFEWAFLSPRQCLYYVE